MRDYLPIILVFVTVLTIGAVAAFAEPVYDWLKRRFKEWRAIARQRRADREILESIRKQHGSKTADDADKHMKLKRGE
ncbi:hypothetical protein LCGC14_0777610 [marine sediment metagenome]|uniref:Uncharacterized protein n=1 Tax=marine sediment metagenome TaxID=412755 RepID=A0A0F9SGE0_9ZZZZ